MCVRIGVESATIKGDHKNEIEVTGDGIDAADLTTSLRKKFPGAELMRVEDVKPDPDKPKPPDPKPSPPEPPQPIFVESPLYRPVLLTEHDPYYDNSPCSIM